MLHKPKISTLKHLHSIPRYFMHSIPIGSLVALLTLNLVLINPVIQSQTYALEEDVGRNTGTNTLTTEKENNNITNSSSTHSSVRDTATNDNEEISNNNNDLDTVEREDSTVSKASENTDNNNAENIPVVHSENSDLTLEISGILDQVTPANAGSVAYRSHNITVSATDIVRYTLQLTSANNSSELANTNNYTISGAGGNTPNGMADNTWGFAWDETSVDNQNMTYYTLPVYNTTGSDITAGILEDSTDTIPNFTKKLTFAAKFGPNAPAGNYRAAAILSVIAKPKTVGTLWSNGVDSGIQYMQNIDSATSAGGFCNDDIPISTAEKQVEIKLRDSRDENEYTIRKLADGKCWMVENLKLDLSKTSITSENSNFSGNAPLKWNNGSSTALASSSEDFSSGTETIAKWNNGKSAQGGENWDPKYGYYYNWCAATAGSCTTATSANAIANSSICPKGWRLPIITEYVAILRDANVKFWYGEGYIEGVNPSTILNGAPYNFIYSGAMSGNSINNGTWGAWWSSTSYDSEYAHTMNNSQGIDPNIDGLFPRYAGYSVRCIAE